MTHPRWLDVLFVGSLGATVAFVGAAIAREVRRPIEVEQRIVAALDVVDRCETCHDAADHPGNWVDEHPVERFGCTPCHGGQGLATTKEGAHEAALDWEWPLRSAAEREAACGGCHLGSSVEGAPVLSRGRVALDERGCAGCHDVPGYGLPDFAPRLDGLRDKVTPGWVRAWLLDPGALNPDHRMPVFTLTEDDRDALLAFLFSLPGPEVQALGVEGDAERGRRVVSYRRCATCHRIEERGGGHAPDLSTAGAKLAPGWLAAYLMDTHRLRADTRMPGFRLSEQDAADVVAYAREQWVPDTAGLPWATLEAPVDPALAAKGRARYAELGCAGCHAAGDVARQRIGVALTSLGSRRRDDLPRAAEGALPDLPAWIARKARDPHAFDSPGGSPARMPAFTSLGEEEAVAIGVALASLRKEAPPADYVVQPEGARSSLPSGETRRIIQRYRCLVCHRIGGEGGDISRVPLDGVGARVRREWLERFLVEPVTIRMDQAERMPVLGISEEESRRLAAWIETTLGDDRIAETGWAVDEATIARGRAEYQSLGCPACHVAEGVGEMKGPVLDGARDRLDPDYVVAMLTLGPSVVPGGRHPPETQPEDTARAVAAWITTLGAPATE
ncbi:MAG: c-type cytochrome [Myxococcota bacterium]